MIPKKAKINFYWKIFQYEAHSFVFGSNRTQPIEKMVWEEWGYPYVLDDARLFFFGYSKSAALKKFQQKRSVTNSYSNHHFVHFLCKSLNQSMNYLHSRDVFEGGKHFLRRFVCGMIISNGISKFLTKNPNFHSGNRNRNTIICI